MIAKCPLLPPKATNRCAALSKPRASCPASYLLSLPTRKKFERFNIQSLLLLPRRAGGIINYVRTPYGVCWRDLTVRRLRRHTAVKQQTRSGNQKSGPNDCSLCNRR